MQERQWITARRSELDALVEELTKQLQEVQVERDELAIAEWVLNRLAEQVQADAGAVAPVSVKVAGRAVLLIPHRSDAADESALPDDYRKILAIVREADGPVQVRAVGEWLGLDASVRGMLGAAAGEDDQARRPRLTAQPSRRQVPRKCHGLLVIALTDDRGRLLWVSTARPGRTSEITACRHDQLTAKLRAAGLGAIADLGFVGLDDSGPDDDPAVITGYKAARNRPLTRSQKLSNTALVAVWAPVEHGFAHLKNWRVLGKVRTHPTWATALVRSLLVLTNREVSR
jgi:hypothetical protein